MFTLGSVLAAHLLPLLWYLTANSSSAVTVTPPLLTGVFVQQPASQAAPAAQQAAPPKPELKTQPKLKQTEVKHLSAKPTNVRPAAAKAVKPAEPAVRQMAPVTQAEPGPPPAGVATPVAAAKDSAAASAVPVSAPVLNATAHYNAPPHYPRLSRKLREQGTVVLELTVLASGKVADVTVQQSSGYPRLDKAALSAVQHWRYQPAQCAGKAIDYRYRQRIEFSLTEGVKQ
ncbi:energy transducer TonB [Rheinheimera sp.]|uniref:energy transducer TonB n=1 Tax=Rheinheimera sp. TaxID=1869214 RepID=UPI0027355297|nr:energy transducer TonB [Rheinheimera sp.]MDP2716529.1 energy transducer TonB [Rheinheimera sp.]